jgi:hypothetical protein
MRRRGLTLHTPNPQSDPDPPQPGPEIPNPSVPPDMEPVVPQQDPPPGRGTDGEPPPVIARGLARHAARLRQNAVAPRAIHRF